MLSHAQTAVLNDARRLLSEQTELARAAPATGAISDVAATPFGQGYLVGVVDALCQVHGAPFDEIALGIFGAVLDEMCERDTTAERDAAIEALASPSRAFDDGYHYGGNEALGWKRRACVPSALVIMARKRK
jgi:hypothetical protein